MKITGRPTKYKPEHNKQAHILVSLGATDGLLAEFFQVNPDTIYEWKKAHPEFLREIEKARIVADAEIATALFKRAVGYNFKEVRTKKEGRKVTTFTIIKHCPPNVSAMIFWLRNRQPGLWNVANRKPAPIEKPYVKQIFKIGDTEIEM